MGNRIGISKRIILSIVQFILGIVIVAILIYQADPSETYRVLLSADLKYIFIASLFIVSASMIIAFSFYLVLLYLNYKANLLGCIQANFAGQLASDLTPGRVGYLITPFIMGYLSSIPFEPCAVATMLSSIADFSVRAILATISALFLISPVESISGVQWIIVASSLILAVSALLFSILLWSEKPRLLILRLEKFGSLSRFLDPLLERFEIFQKEGVKAKKALAPALITMFFVTPLDTAALYFFSASVDVEVSPFILVLIYSIVSSFTYLPITLAGLGVQEGVLAALLQFFGTPVSKGVSIALLFRFFYTLTDLIGLPSILKIDFSKILWGKEKDQ
ncbi:MAG: lysylphosphatidylglycerol synthase transmembrane domain-containing protein [Thermoproteota archaeon]